MERALGTVLGVPLNFVIEAFSIFTDGAAFFFGGATAALIAGLLLLFKYRSQRLWGFLVPFALSQTLLFTAAIYFGQWPGQGPAPAFIAYLVVQAGLITWLVVHAKGARWPAAAFAVFNSAYALWAAFIAGMMFPNDWI